MNIFIILISILTILFFLHSTNNFVNTNNIEIVVARYNEKLNWLNDPPFNKYPVIVYNKGVNEDFTKTKMIEKIITLPNVGREGHTFLYHIIHNYDNLANITCFFAGSIDTEQKFKKASVVLDEIENNNKKTVLACSNYKNIQQELYSFNLDKYFSAYTDNNITNDTNLELSKIRPFGKWYKHHFGDIITTCFAINMVFSLSKDDILKKPKEYYENIIKEVDSHSNPEAGHYIERSIEAIFYPLPPDALISV